MNRRLKRRQRRQCRLELLECRALLSADFGFVATFGSSLRDNANEVAVDNAGNTYTSGWFAGTVDFDPGPGTFNLTSVGGEDIFVSKLDSDGNLVWARSVGSSGNDNARGITVDASGNVYTTGNFWYTADFDPGTGTFNLTSFGGLDAYVSKLDPTGINHDP